MNSSKCMLSGRLLAVWALGLTALTAIAPTASAAPVLSYTGFCGATAYPDIEECVYQTGTSDLAVAAASTTSAYAGVYSFYGAANAAAAYALSVDYGRLGAGALAGAVADAPSVNQDGNNPLAVSNAAVGFVDEITPYSTTWDTGTPVLINFDIPIHGIIYSTLFPGGYDFFQYSISWLIGGVRGEYTGVGSGGVDEFDFTESGNFMALVGQASIVSVGIDVYVSAGDVPYISSGMLHTSSADINANFQNTVKLFLEAADPNVTLVAASGHDYAPVISSVPEPATLAMVFPGLVGLIWYRRRIVK